MRKLLAILFTLIIVLMTVQPAFAADTLLPGGAQDFNDAQCKEMVDKANADPEARATAMNKTKDSDCTGSAASIDAPCREEVLSCAIKTGLVHLWMLPFYITFIIEFLIGLVGLVSVLFVIIGGYYYAYGGLTEDKEKGKKTVMYALVGMALAVLAWIIVNIIQTQLTS